MIESEPLKSIFSSAEIIPFKKGETLYSEGDSPKYVYYLETGLVGLIRSSVEGHSHILRIFHPGRTIGHRSMIADEPYHAESKCLEDSQVRRLTKTLFFEVLSSKPQLGLAIMQLLARELRGSEIHRMLNTDSDVRTRVASAILVLIKLYPEHLWTRTEIANFIASRTPTVIKVLGELEKQGYIAQNGRNIQILDEKRLSLLTDGLDEPLP